MLCDIFFENYYLQFKGKRELYSEPYVDEENNSKKTAEQRTFWQVVNLVLPIALLGLFGFVKAYLRKRKYGNFEASKL